jgi:hypothetical protein
MMHQVTTWHFSVHVQSMDEYWQMAAGSESTFVRAHHRFTHEKT